MEYPLTFEQYQQGLKEGKFLGLKCVSCGTYNFPPLGVCEHCKKQDLTVTEIEGEGTLRTFTVIRVAPEGKEPPYIIAMVELAQGPWAVGMLVEVNPDQADMKLIGKKVKLGSTSGQGTEPLGDIQILTFTLI